MAASARRRAVGLRNPWLVSAVAASMRVPIMVRLTVDGKYGDADLDAEGDAPAASRGSPYGSAAPRGTCGMAFTRRLVDDVLPYSSRLTTYVLGA